MSSTAPQTLKSITATKIGELSKQRTRFDARKHEILTAANNAADARSKAQVLLEGVTRLKGYPGDAFDKDDLDESLAGAGPERADNASDRATHINIRRFLLQSRYDPSASERSLKDAVAQLESEVRCLELRHEHAALYSQLVTEWLTDLDGGAAAAAAGEKENSADFQPVGRAEMHEQRATWESYVFDDDARVVDADTIRGYLDGLFGQTALSQQALDELRERMRTFGAEFAERQEWFTVEDLRWVSKSLLRADLLSKEKTVILKEFMQSKEVVQEVADVLNMRLAALDSWGWPADGVPVEMRRQLNGKYRVYMDEDLLDSLLLHYLGVKWAVTFGEAFDEFLNSRAWRSLHEQVPEREKERRRYFCDSRGQNDRNVNDYRQETYKTDYFMAQLPRSEEDGVPEYGEDSNSMEKSSKNALDTKHSLLHMLITESIIHRTLHGQFTVTRSDFKYFGPSLPHTTMLTVLAYFGVPEYWLNFFRAFLAAPLKFTQDGPNASTRVRRRGVPMSHALSDCFGEVVLFCMDYAVNQSTKGAFLYRLHDDFWFWGHKQTCVRAWEAMTEFTKVMGLEFNEEKTGTVQLGENPEGSRWRTRSSDLVSSDDEPVPDSPEIDDSILPRGEIRWGFLKLDSQEGRFIIDQTRVDQHIAELRTQLSSCRSIFSWIQAWNSYFARFFSNNFAKPAVCFGRSHIDMAVSTLGRIERALFPNGVTAHLRTTIAAQFNIHDHDHDLPEGFFYFPVELGGLELVNPYIPLLAMCENIKQTPSRRMHRAFLDDEHAYHAARERFERVGPNSAGSARSLFDAADAAAAFPPLEEFMANPESRSEGLLRAYKDLIRMPAEVEIERTQAFRGSQMGLGNEVGGAGRRRGGIISARWADMSAYWKWVAELYHGDLVRKYGRLAAVDREFMPLGVIRTLKEGRFRWQG
ncbi:hypothetical protein PHISP_05276 [Aspergillus sp. HF37]|nr:hypothetical protein PHISP_05276 [Aspergillus sp. HF37]